MAMTSMYFFCSMHLDKMSFIGLAKVGLPTMKIATYFSYFFQPSNLFSSFSITHCQSVAESIPLSEAALYDT